MAGDGSEGLDAKCVTAVYVVILYVIGSDQRNLFLFSELVSRRGCFQGLEHHFR